MTFIERHWHSLHGCQGGGK